MKKSIIALATAVACLFAFSACSPEDEAQLLNAVNNSGIAESLGSIYLVPSDLQNGTQYVDHFAGITAGDTLWFNSAMCDTTFTYDAYNVYPGVLFVGGNIQTSPNIKVNFPMLGINLRDTDHQDYPVSAATGDFSFVFDINENNWEYYLTHNDIQYGNMMVIALDTFSYYICYGGNIHIDAFSPNGQIVSGRIENVTAFYVTKNQLIALAALDEGLRNYLYVLLPHATFNGEIQCRRTTWVQEVAAELERNRTNE